MMMQAGLRHWHGGVLRAGLDRALLTLSRTRTWNRALASSATQLGPEPAYSALVQEGKLREDPHQRKAVHMLQEFHNKMHTQLSSAPSSGGGFISRLFGGLSGSQAGGVYMFGGVGIGKTKLMDLLYESQPSDLPRLRVHFHSFMLDVHERLHALRKTQGPAVDPLPIVAQQYASQARLLCFDEFQVTDVADAMILKHLFSTLFDAGVWVVFTSNRPPHDLYKNGLNRPLFLPFIALLQARCTVYNLDSGTDYRLLGLHKHAHIVYFAGPDAAKELEQVFSENTSNLKVETDARPDLIENREIVVPRSAEQHAWFTFDDLCRHAHGASDYLAIAKAYHTIYIADVPQLSIDRRDEMRRFITLVDVLYENHTKLYIGADVPLGNIYAKPPLAADGSFTGEEEHFALDRTISRLTEMQNEAYLRDHYIRVHHPERFASLRSHVVSLAKKLSL